MATLVEQKAALEKSIEKWTEIADTGNVIGRLGPFNCALCRLYLLNGSCNGCPVKKRTGQPFCEGSPYKWFDDKSEVELSDHRALEEVKEHARMELEFLKSLVVPERIDCEPIGWIIWDNDRNEPHRHTRGKGSWRVRFDPPKIYGSIARALAYAPEKDSTRWVARPVYVGDAL